MPIYEYGCEKCGSVVERIQKFSDPPLIEHDGCGGKLTKLISQSSFHLKGSGWYVTDYAKKASGESASEEEPQKKDATKTDGDADGSKAKSSKDSGAASKDKKTTKKPKSSSKETK